MQYDVKDISGKKVKSLELDPGVFGVEMSEGLLHLVVKAYRANRRQGTASTKTRSSVSGTGKKPFKQKGTGNARQGTSRSPNMPGGAIAHGPQSRSFRQDINAKAKRKALAVALSDKVRHNKLHILDDWKMDKYSTKHVVGVLGNLGIKSAIITDSRKDDQLYKSARNIYKVDAKQPEELNAENVLAHDTVILTETAIASIVRRFAGEDA